ALLNMDGEVVGINSAKLASTEVEGIGYAIAISDVSDILEDLMNEETRDKVEDGEHGVLGIMGSTVSEEGSQVYGIPEGVFVKEVTEGGGAEKAGIQENSVITKFDGKTVTSIEELVDLLEYYEPGEKVEVTLQIPHGNSYKEETVTVKLGKSTDTEEKDDDKDSDDNSDNLFKDFEENEDDGFDQGGDFDDWQ
ncbi:MAG: S1C family serine protease, partial [Blautia sp.]|nr:S1C family serine protease [Blautia sp.]